MKNRTSSRKMEINEYRILMRDIQLNRLYKAGEVVYILDAFFENGHPFIAIRTETGVQEAGFKPKEKGFKSQSKLKRFLEGISMPYSPSVKKVTVCPSNIMTVYVPLNKGSQQEVFTHMKKMDEREKVFEDRPKQGMSELITGLTGNEFPFNDYFVAQSKNKYLSRDYGNVLYKIFDPAGKKCYLHLLSDGKDFKSDGLIGSRIVFCEQQNRILEPDEIYKGMKVIYCTHTDPFDISIYIKPATLNSQFIVE